MIYGTLITENKSCIVLDKILGFEGENNSNKIIFNFKDGFIDGYGVLAVKRGKDNGTIELDKVGESYIFTVKSSVLSQVGDIEFQVVITQDDGTVYKYSTFIMTVNDAIDTDIPLPEEYPSWINMANTKLAEVDKAIENAEAVGNQLLEDKENGVFNGKDGKDGVDGKDGANGKDGINGTNGTNGKDGFSPVATVTQTDTGATISITDTNGTTTAIVRNGKDGESGILEETDPVYLADKPNIALKNELPTKVSELQNDSGYLTEYTETDPTIPTHVKNITQENINNWNNKSEFSGSYNDLSDKPTIPSIEGLATTEQLTQGLATKQDTLTAGNNITIENGVISATGGGGTTELPIASSTTLGGIKVGEGLEITEDGILSAITGGVSGGTSYKETELLSEPKEYTQGGTSGTTIGQDLTLLDSIENYDDIVFNFAVSSGNTNQHPTEYTMKVSNIIYNSTTTNNWDGSRFSLVVSIVDRFMGAWFKNSNTLYIHNTFANSSVPANAYFRINSIKGIKY